MLSCGNNILLSCMILIYHHSHAGVTIHYSTLKSFNILPLLTLLLSYTPYERLPRIAGLYAAATYWPAARDISLPSGRLSFSWRRSLACCWCRPSQLLYHAGRVASRLFPSPPPGSPRWRAAFICRIRVTSALSCAALAAASVRACALYAAPHLPPIDGAPLTCVHMRTVL